MTDKKGSILHLFRRHYRDMYGYVSAGMETQKNDQTVFLNANENPYILEGLESFNRYPEPQPHELVQAMASFYGVKDNQLLITRGADEGIALLTRLFIEPHKDSILINPPTFGVYKVYAHGIPANHVLETPLKKLDGTFVLNTEAIAHEIEKAKNLKLIYLTNPNNPTGNCFSENDILEVLKIAKDKAIVVLDETYAEFKPECSFVDRLDEFPHLIILRTLSKSFSMAGMRIGAILSSNPEVITTLKTKVMEVYPIPVASAEAALKVLSPDIMKIAKENIQKLLTERKRLEIFWKNQSGIRHVYQSDANFLLIEMDKATQFAKYCERNQIVLRDFSNNPLTENCLRISIGTPEQNDRVIDLYNEFLKV